MKMTTWQSLHPRYSASKIHVERLGHRFRLFIKSLGEDRVYRVEESLHPENRAIKASPGQLSVEEMH
jgi:hypothetical protein